MAHSRLNPEGEGECARKETDLWAQSRAWHGGSIARRLRRDSQCHPIQYTRYRLHNLYSPCLSCVILIPFTMCKLVFMLHDQIAYIRLNANNYYWNRSFYFASRSSLNKTVSAENALDLNSLKATCFAKRGHQLSSAESRPRG
jgi:hypothetical protein